jgi:hypothetical protein
MENGEEFEISYKQLNEISDDLIARPFNHEVQQWL